MKKIMTFVAAAFLCAGFVNVNAQNDFKGTIKYSVTSSGSMAVEIPADMAEFELKVMDNKVYANDKASRLFGGMMVKSMVVDGLKVTTASDYSQLLAYIAQSGEQMATYKGDGKIIFTHTYTKNDVDSLTIPCTEGFYIEYVKDQTKEIAGRSTKLAHMHMFGEDGTDNVINVWYDETMGPQNNFLFYGIKGMPMEITLPQGENKAITLTASDIKTGKVKDVDFLMPDGFTTMSQDDMKTFGNELQEVMKYLQDE
jgi:hypothetical protein